MGIVQSSRSTLNQYLKTPIELSQSVLDHICHALDESEADINMRLEGNREMWLNKYDKLDKNFQINSQPLDKETFDNLFETISDYLESSYYKKGEILRNQLIDCYGASKGQPLKCTEIAERFNNWCNEKKRLFKESQKKC